MRKDTSLPCGAFTKVIRLDSHYGNLKPITLRVICEESCAGYSWHFSHEAFKRKSRNAAGDYYKLPEFMTHGGVYFLTTRDALEALQPYFV